MAESLQAPPLPGTAAPQPALHHPTRPVWNPAEEARIRAEQQRAVMEQVESKKRRGRAAPVPEPVDNSLTAQIAIINAERPDRQHAEAGEFHQTMVPRAVCVTGFFLAFAFPAVFLLLNHQGHADLIDGRFHPDETAKRVSLVLLGGAALCMLVGWLWWGVTAALNARHRARWALSPLYVPLTYFGVAAVAIGAGLSPRWLHENSIYAKACALALGVVMYFSTLSTFRRTAQSVNASTKYFTRLIVVPWVTLAAVGVFVWFTHNLPATAQTTPYMGLVLGLMLVQGLYGLTMYQAMLDLDRACVGTRMLHNDDQEFAKFLKLAR
jgi:hypothetical protein